jgi:hypothetical protein
MRDLVLAAVAMAALLGAEPAGALASYAVSAQDEAGSSTGAAAVALGVPDYAFVGDLGLGFGGTNTDVFSPGEATVLEFGAPLWNVPGQDDLAISAYVGGAGDTDSAVVLVEVSEDGGPWQSLGSFDTAEGRTTYPFPQERAHAGVKHFGFDFGSADRVTHVRLTHLAGTAEGLRLDAVEGFHPETGSAHAFEMRFERYRNDASERFLVRIKNLGTPGAAPIRGYRIGRPPDTAEWLENTDTPALSVDGDLICVANCIGDADQIPGVAFLETEWSLDGANPAPAGTGLPAGHRAAFQRQFNNDIDAGGSYLGGFEFEVRFADGLVHAFDYDTDVLGQAVRGQLYQKYTYFNPAPALSGPRPVDYYEFVPEPADALLLVTGALVLLGARRLQGGPCAEHPKSA